MKNQNLTNITKRNTSKQNKQKNTNNPHFINGQARKDRTVIVQDKDNGNRKLGFGLKSDRGQRSFNLVFLDNL